MPELKSGFFLVDTSFSNITLFCCSIIIYSLFISWIGMVIFFLTAPYAAAWMKMFLDDCWLPFARRTTIGSLVLVSCISIGTTVRHDISLIYSDLDPEGTWTEASHAWIFIFKLGGLRWSSFVFTKLPLMTFPDDTLNVSHASSNMEFIW